MPVLSQNLIDEIKAVIKADRDLLESGKVYLWKHKESRDQGSSWIPTNRLDVYQNILDALSGEHPEPDDYD